MKVPISLANNDWLLLISSLMTQTVYPIKMKLQLEWKQWCCWILPQMLTLQMAPQGTIVNIIPDPRETAHHNCSTTSTVFLQYPPSFIMVWPLQHPGFSISGLLGGVLPLFSTLLTFSLPGKVKMTIHREQFTLTLAYAFIDFKSQVQTTECILVDLGKPPSGVLTSFNAYVGLSRSHRWITIRLLHNVDEALFTTHPSEELLKEDVCLKQLACVTFQWYKASDYGSIGQFSGDSSMTKF